MYTALDEIFYLQHAYAKDGEFAIPRQRCFAGVEDAHVTQLVFSKRFFMDAKARQAAHKADKHSLQASSDNPDLWLVSLHYEVG